MRNRITSFLTVSVLLLAVQSLAYDSVKMREIHERSPFVVRVDSLGDKNGMGTGVLIEERGEFFILTNAHVVSGQAKIYVSFPRQYRQEVTVIGASRAADLALLTAPKVPRGISPAQLGNSDMLKIGDEVYAFGHPYGFENVTAGNITSLKFYSWLYLVSQAPINPGNSGGPLFNKEHEVVAINTAIVQGANLVNFSIPINHVRRILPRLIRESVVEHGDTGFSFGDTLDIHPGFFSKLGFLYPPPEDGIMVLDVPESSSAAAAGIKAGDLLIKFNGLIIKNAKELDMKIFFDYRVGQEVAFTLKRGTQLFERRVRLSEYKNPIRHDNNEKEKR